MLALWDYGGSHNAGHHLVLMAASELVILLAGPDGHGYIHLVIINVNCSTTYHGKNYIVHY